MDMETEERAARARKGSPFLNTAQAAFYVGLAEKTLHKMRWQGVGPLFRKHGRIVRYHINDLDTWSELNRRRSTTVINKSPGIVPPAAYGFRHKKISANSLR
jgi:hypothetical protein